MMFLRSNGGNQQEKRALYGMLLLVFYMAVTGSARASEKQKPLIVVGTVISGMFEEGGDGYFDHIYRLVTEGYPASPTLQMEPINRARRTFNAGDANCLFVGAPMPERYIVPGRTEADLLFSEAVSSTSLKAYRIPGAPPVESVQELRENYVIIDNGIGSPDLVIERLSLDETRVAVAPSLEHGFKMLDVRPMSALVAIELDVIYLQNRKPLLKWYSVSNTFKVDSSYDVFVCERSKETERFLQFVNGKIRAAKEAGVFERLLLGQTVDQPSK